MMRLCLDSGNTRLKWGFHDDGCWQATGALAQADITGLSGVLATMPHPERIVACNVAGDDARVVIEQLAGDMGVAIDWVVSCIEQCGVRNSYADPAQLGADRWAALIGAHALHDGACLVVNAGTATTIDVLDASGMFRGGLILPGIDLMRAALARNTARLPLAAGEFAPLPRNTADAIVSGSLQATAGAIDRMFGGIMAEPDAVCLLSGGAAGNVAALLDIPVRRIDNLVLEGLARCAETS